MANNINFGGTQSQDNDNWKADAFLNIRLPRQDGKQPKLTSVALKLSRKTDTDVIEFLRANPEDGIERLKAAMVIDFQDMADVKESALAI